MTRIVAFIAAILLLIIVGVAVSGFDAKTLPVFRDLGTFVTPYNASDSLKLTTGASTQYYSGTTLTFYWDSTAARVAIRATIGDSLASIDSSNIINVGVQDLPVSVLAFIRSGADTAKYARVLVNNPASRSDSIVWDALKAFVISRDLRVEDSVFFGHTYAVWLDSTLVDSIVKQKGVYSAGAGDITEVIAGDGLEGGATAGSATLTVLPGFGVRIDNDSTEVDSTELSLAFLVLHGTADSALGAGRLGGLPASGYVPSLRTITPGAGLSGSTPLDLSADRTLTVTTGWGLSIPSDNVVVRVQGTGTGLIDSLAISYAAAQTINATWTFSGNVVNTANPWVVNEGGSGRGTATAWGLLVGGTTSTGAHQSVAAPTSSNLVLTPALTSPSTSLPIWNSWPTPDSISAIRLIVRNAAGTIVYRMPRSAPASGNILKYPGTGDTLQWTADATGGGGTANVADTGSGAIAGELITFASSGDKTFTDRIMTFAAGSNRLTFNMNRDWPGADDADSLGGVIASSYALKAVTLTAGAGLTGGGDISANRTFDIGDGSGVTVAANDIGVNVGYGLRILSDLVGVQYVGGIRDSVAAHINDSLPNYYTRSATRIVIRDSLTNYYTRAYIDANMGDILSIGDVVSGAAFDGTQGTKLIFNDAEGDDTLRFANTAAAKAWVLPNTSTGNDTITQLGNTVTGTGAIVRATSPTITTVTLSGATTFGGDLEVGTNSIDGSTTLSLDPDNDGVDEIIIGNAIMTFEGGAVDPTLTWTSGAFEATGTLNVTSTLSQGGTSVVLQTRTLTPGAGLAGTAALDLSANRTFTVETGWGTAISTDSVTADSLELDDVFGRRTANFTIGGNWDNTANPWAINEGGTGAATFTTNGVIFGNGASALGATAQGANGEFLGGNGASAPTFKSIVDGDIPNSLTIDNSWSAAVLSIRADTIRIAKKLVFASNVAPDAAFGYTLDSADVDSVMRQVGRFQIVAGSGDITSVGNVASGAAFDGTQGTTLTFDDAQGDGTFTFADLSGAKTWRLPNTSTGNDTLTLLGNTITGSGGIVLATSPSVATPTITGGATMTGFASLAPSGTTPVEYRFMEASGNGTNYFAIRAPYALAGNTTIKLPLVAGAAGQILKLDATATDSLTWTADDDLPDADEITESMLKSVNGPTDELFLSYELTTGDFEWQTPAGDNLGNHTATSDLEMSTFSIDGGGAAALVFDPSNDGVDDLRMSVVGGVSRLTFLGTGLDPYVEMGNNGGLVLVADSASLTSVGGGTTTKLRFMEVAANGANYSALRAADNLTGDVVWTLPDADGLNTQVLKTNGTGTLSFGYADSANGGAVRAVAAKRADSAYTIAWVDADSIITDLPMEPTGGSMHIGHDWDGGGAAPHDSIAIDTLIMRVATPSANGTPLEVRDTTLGRITALHVMHYRVNVPIPIQADSIRNVVFTAATDDDSTYVVGKFYFGHPDSSTGILFKVSPVADSITGSISTKTLIVNRDVNSLAGVYGVGGQVSLLFTFRMRSGTKPESARLYGARVVWSQKRVWP
jgi:hypothetical protein